MAAGPISEHLRRRAGEIMKAWLEAVQRDVPEARRLSRPALVDHMPEFLVAIADFIDGDTDKARRGFDRLAEGHAVQRLGFGITLEALTDEYAVLREVALTDLMRVRADGDEVRAELIRFNTGMDQAINESVRRYAQRRDEIRERFIGILGHDLRNPLGAIEMAASVLVRAEDLPPRHLVLGSRILRSVDRMQRMVGEVLGFAQGHLGGGIPCEPTPADMGDLVHAVVDEVSAAHPERAIKLTTTGDLRGAWDHARVQQALANLIGNAVHHGEDPIQVAVRADGLAGVITEVANRGEPIPEDAMPTLFDPFRRHASAPRKHGAGLGLGLYIVNQIALAHGATIDVRSTAADGTRICVRWPRTLPGEPGADPDPRGG